MAPCRRNSLGARHRVCHRASMCEDATHASDGGQGTHLISANVSWYRRLSCSSSRASREGRLCKYVCQSCSWATRTRSGCGAAALPAPAPVPAPALTGCWLLGAMRSSSTFVPGAEAILTVGMRRASGRHSGNAIHPQSTRTCPFHCDHWMKSWCWF